MSKLYDGDSFEVEGVTFTLSIEPDDNFGPPWVESDCHGVISDWTSRAKKPSEVILCEGRGYYYYYDVAESMRIAKRDGCNAAPFNVEGETKGQRAYKSVMADYDYLRRWCDDEWCYVVVIVACSDLPNRPSKSLWGVESFAEDYIAEVAKDLAQQILYSVSEEVRKAVA